MLIWVVTYLHRKLRKLPFFKKTFVEMAVRHTYIQSKTAFTFQRSVSKIKYFLLRPRRPPVSFCILHTLEPLLSEHAALCGYGCQSLYLCWGTAALQGLAAGTCSPYVMLMQRHHCFSCSCMCNFDFNQKFCIQQTYCPPVLLKCWEQIKTLATTSQSFSCLYFRCFVNFH